ncbi:MAG TPA: DNA repair protein RecN [Candidatus Enterococcus avicola]|uniref:DNA repair protein RecN n=1 Tax=Candidatus Enterococcus avicola TaxID=2838561 RepID=A0A9D2JIN4_9ENTE|nr:DNA repair protein RecN [Candidatus Enterococcus avicola]
MLLEMTIKNFAIIPYLNIRFQQGMTALTGETGAGKSIIIDAMGLLAGGRGSSDYIRHGEDKCLLEGLFEWPVHSEFPSLMEELGIDTSESFLVLQRDMSRSGKNICRVNGRIVTLVNLRRVGMYLVDIQGQNEHQELLQPEKHLSLMDNFGTKEFKQKLEMYQFAFNDYQVSASELRKIQKNEQSYAQRMDMLHFQSDEIEQAALQENEEEYLIEERDKLTNFQKIVDALGQTYAILSEESSSIVDGVGRALNEIQEIEQLDAEYQKISENLQSAYYMLQDAASEVSKQLDFLELDEERLEVVVARLELIRQLKRKYGESIPQILSYYTEIVAELDQMGHSENRLEVLSKELAMKEERLWTLANELHSERRLMAVTLEKEIMQELSDLYMENARFNIRFKEAPYELGINGIDQVAFYLSSNLGEDLKPLVKVASGGELSRILLALKTIFSKGQGMTSIVFDEVDTGVSGRVAQAIAEKIAKIAKNSQVLCITHLPQVAAQADYQYFISKEVVDERTQTKITQLSATERVDEIARMLAGQEITHLTLEHAKELLDLAQQATKKE